MAKKENKKNQTGFWLACWILGFLIILILFLVKQDDIITTLKTTGLFERLFGKTPAFVQNHEVKEKNDDYDEKENVIILKTEEKKNPVPENKEERKSETQENTIQEEKKSEENKVSEKTPVVTETKTQNQKIEETKKTETVKEEKKVSETKPKTTEMRTQKLYFVYIGEDGTLSRKVMTRSVEKNDSPLVTNINLLLAGPDSAESAKGCRSLIPEGSKLLSASVRDGIAYLNFNESFEFNTIGMDGYQAQLMQIVFTATEFSTVSSVQFLIEGQKKEYLGSEGVWIGSPLSRANF